MAMALSRFSHWIWPGSRSRRTHEPPAGRTAMANGLFPDSPSGFREPGAVGLASQGGGGARPPRKVKSRRRGGRGEARVDREHDMVIVPSDGDGGGGLSDSDSDCSDWSIGWLEPHAPELQSDGDSESSFAVLVPCYRRGRIDQTGRPDGRFSGPSGVAAGSVSDNKNFVDQWLSSLQNR